MDQINALMDDMKYVEEIINKGKSLENYNSLIYSLNVLSIRVRSVKKYIDDELEILEEVKNEYN